MSSLGSPYKAMQVREYGPVLLCKHLIFHYVLAEVMICNLLKLLTRTVFVGTTQIYDTHLAQIMIRHKLSQQWAMH